MREFILEFIVHAAKLLTQIEWDQWCQCIFVHHPFNFARFKLTRESIHPAQGLFTREVEMCFLGHDVDMRRVLKCFISGIAGGECIQNAPWSKYAMYFVHQFNERKAS